MVLARNLSEIAALVGGRVEGDGALFIENISSLHNARACDVAIVFEPQEGGVFAPLDQRLIEQSKAGVIIASQRVVAGKRYILVDDPLAAFQKLSSLQQRAHPAESFFIHPRAFVDEQAILEVGVVVHAHATIEALTRIGEGSSIGSQSYIGKQCSIGSGVFIHPGVIILDRSIIGDRTIIHSGAVVGSDGFGYHVSKVGLRKIPQIGSVRIGKDVEIGANVCIDRAAFDETVIGDGVKIDNLVHIAHNVTIGAHSAIIAQSGIAGSAKIGMGCQIGGQVGIKDHTTVGNGAKIVSQSAVLKDVASGAVVCGTPAIDFSAWKRITISLLSLPDLLKQGRLLHEAHEKRKNRWWRRVFCKIRSLF